jgi:hypothetical protein
MNSILYLLWILFLVYSAMVTFLVVFVRLIRFEPATHHFKE